MNKLEEQMEEQTDIFYDPTAGEKDYFKAGAQFVIDLELPVKFAKWLHVHWIPFDENGNWQAITPKGHAIESTETLYKFWIENIYGR